MNPTSPLSLPPEFLARHHPQRLRPWRELANLASICMEMIWLVLWYRILVRSGRAVPYWQAFAVLGGMLLLAYLLARGMDYLNLKITLRRGMLAMLLLLSLPVGLKTLLYTLERVSLGELFSRPLNSFSDMANFIPAEFIVMLVVLLAWYRGITIVERQIGPDKVIGSFRTGVIALFIYGLVLPLTGEKPGNIPYIFLFFGLLAMSAARIYVLGQLRGGHRIPFDRQWLIGIALAVLGVVGLASLVAGIMGGRAFTLLTDIYRWVVYILALLISPLSWLTIQLIFVIGQWLRVGEVFQALLNFLYKFQEDLLKWLDQLVAIFKHLDIPGLQGVIHFILSLKTLLLWGLILLAILLVLMTVRRTIWREERTDDQELQSLPGQDGLFDLLRIALRRQFSKIAAGISRGARRRSGRLLAAARIRRIYARLLDMSAKLGSPRPASRTPLEFLPNLERLFPASSSELAIITNAYQRVRYGELSETLQELEKVEDAWKRVSEEGRAQLAVHKHSK